MSGALTSQVRAWQRVQAWQAAGRVSEIGGHRLFVRVQDGDGPPVVLLHGFPSSSYDWRSVIGLLGDRRIVAFDFLGFGLSEKPRDYPYSLHLQADFASVIVDRLVHEPVVLVAHDMGTSVATELLARDLEKRLPFAVDAVLLLNGSIVIDRANLTTAQKFLRSRLGPLATRLANERGFARGFGRLFSAEHPLNDQEAADQWALLAYHDGHRILDRLTYYLYEREMFAPRWHGGLRDWPGALELAWAGHDPVCTEAVLDAVLELRPDAPLTRLPELGHYAQIEDPGAVASIIARLAPAGGSASRSEPAFGD